MQTATATQKPTTPPPAPAAAKPAPAGQAAPATQTQQAKTQAPAPAQTGYQATGVKDGFEAAEARRPVAPAAQGDTFQAAAAAPMTLAAPSGKEQVASALKDFAQQQQFASALNDAGQQQQLASSLKGYMQQQEIASALKDPSVQDALLKAVRPAVVEEPSTQYDPNDPTVGMSPEERAQYDALSPEERAAYDELHRQACGNYQARNITGPELVATPGSSVQALRDLLMSGQLGDYLTVAKSLEGSPEALADLQDLLFQGLLPGARSNVDLSNTLDNLVKLATEELLPGMDRQQVLGSLLSDLNHPERIAQGIGNPYCAGAEYAFAMAMFDPTEYARMVAGLATDGKVEMTPFWARLHGGNESNVLEFKGTFQDPDPHGRTPTQQLMASSFVKEAEKGDSWIERLLVRDGINGAQFMDQLNEYGYMGGGWDAVYMPPEPNPEQTAFVEQMLTTGTPPMFVNTGDHWVTVLGYENGQVIYHDAMTGEIVREDLNEFTKKVSSIVYQGGGTASAVPEGMQDEANAEDGGGGTSNDGMGGGGNN